MDNIKCSDKAASVSRSQSSGQMESVVRKDHDEKISGRAVYVGDHIGTGGILTGRMLRSRWARARIKGVSVPKLPEGYFYVDASDVPGDNNVNIVLDDTPVFCRGTAEYIGEPIAMICGPDEAVVNELLHGCVIDFEELEPVLDIRRAERTFFEYKFGHGGIERAFAEADKVYEEEFETGYQDQVYLETQGMMAERDEDGKMFVHGSMQCPWYVHNALVRVLGCGTDGVHVAQDVTGGGFGGKEEFPSILACQTAVAAVKANAPVRCVFSRSEDLEFTSKRHPSLSRYRAAVKDGRVTALECNVTFNAGAYSTLSGLVLERGLFSASGAYDIPNISIRGAAVKTNTVPCGAFRGFGAPQTFFAVEMMMSHIARDLGIEPLDFKRAHLVRQGSMTSTQGRYHFPVPLPAMADETAALCNFTEKRAEYAKPQTGRFRRGIGMSLVYHGGGFTGSGERDIINAVVKLRRRSDGIVEVLTAGGEIGQGIRTAFSKIVARELGISHDRVICGYPDTARVPNSGPTVASRSTMVVGELLRRAAAKLRECTADGETEVEERYREPDFLLPFDADKLVGDAYPTYSWSVSAIEVEIDTLTGTPRILGAFGSFDVGTPIDEKIVTGQMEGGFLQGIGYAALERMSYDGRGFIRNHFMSDYLIPTFEDVPVLKVMLHPEEYPNGPYGAKGAGELPLVGAPAAYIEAVEQALGNAKINRIPFASEGIMSILTADSVRLPADGYGKVHEEGGV